MTAKFFNVLDLVTEEDRGDERLWFAVEPSVMYPAMIEHIQGVLEQNGGVGEHLRIHRQAAATLPEQAWDLAQKRPDEVTAKARELRAEALETARRWFTAMLHAVVGNTPMGLHIIKDEDWRL